MGVCIQWLRGKRPVILLLFIGVALHCHRLAAEDQRMLDKASFGGSEESVVLGSSVDTDNHAFLGALGAGSELRSLGREERAARSQSGEVEMTRQEAREIEAEERKRLRHEKRQRSDNEPSRREAKEATAPRYEGTDSLGRSYAPIQASALDVAETFVTEPIVRSDDEERVAVVTAEAPLTPNVAVMEDLSGLMQHSASRTLYPESVIHEMNANPSPYVPSSAMTYYAGGVPSEVLVTAGNPSTGAASVPTEGRAAFEPGVRKELMADDFGEAGPKRSRRGKELEGEDRRDGRPQWRNNEDDKNQEKDGGRKRRRQESEDEEEDDELRDTKGLLASMRERSAERSRNTEKKRDPESVEKKAAKWQEKQAKKDEALRAERKSTGPFSLLAKRIG